LWFWIGIGRRATITTLCVEGIWHIFDHRLAIVINSGHCLVASKIREICSVGHDDQRILCISHSEHWLNIY
jgi:hypothetical protein